MILPALVLQKPCSKTKSSEYSDLLNKRMGWWRDLDFTSLIRQARTIQSQVNKKSSRKKKPDTTRVFANLMFEGKVSAAIRMLCDKDHRGVLELSEETKAELMKKHPPPAPIKCDSLLCGPLLQIDEIYFSKIDSEMIARSAKMTRGSAGPTQTDADFFRHILTHRNFNIEEKRLREQAANFARRFATRIYNSEAIDSYVNCRLIPLNKCPEVRPIGVGETFRRIIGKTICWILKLDIQEVAGPLQTCTVGRFKKSKYYQIFATSGLSVVPKVK